MTPVDTTNMSEDNTAYQAVRGMYVCVHFYDFFYRNNSSFTAALTPTMIDLENKVIPKICPLWREVGSQLHLETYVLNEIDADCRVHGVRRCCTRMFEEWLKQDTEASWYAVLSACKKVKENVASMRSIQTPYQGELDQLISDFLATCDL